MEIILQKQWGKIPILSPVEIFDHIEYALISFVVLRPEKLWRKAMQEFMWTFS